jgi:hypothetical protein
MRAAWILAVVFALASPARASANESSGVHLTLQGGTDFPIDVGGGLRLEIPGRLELSSDLGVLPGTYVDAANAALVSANAYDATTGTLVHEALKNSLVWRAHLGWRPFPRSGFFFQAGYGMAVLNAELTAAQVSEATGASIPSVVDPGANVQLHSVVQMLDFEVGWRWLIADRLEIRTALGAVHAFASHSTLSVHDAGVVTPYIEQVDQPGAQQIDREVTRYGNTFELTLGLGFRAF